VRLKVQNRAKLRNTEPHFVKIAKKNGDIFFAIFSKKGAKNETADDGGGCMSPRPTARYPQPHAANCQIWCREKW
jgi:hypothetical protein